MVKRPFEGGHDAYTKRQKQNGDTQHHKHSNDNKPAFAPAPTTTLPQSSTPKPAVPLYTPFTTQPGLPELPSISQALAGIPFRHKSSRSYDRNSATADVTYERLEFLGDAYLELIASRLIFHHYSNLTAGQQSQLRELMVKNETLADYARGYGFEDRLDIGDKEAMIKDARNRGNKGINKILGDTVEAYTAAIVLSDVENGFMIAEKWLTALWTPKLVEASRWNFNITQDTSQNGQTDPLKTYDPTAKATLQQKILAGGIKLTYEPYRESEELKGDQLGQNRHYIAVYLSGYGHERRLLGQGTGRNKVEAGNWAAIQALHGETKELVADCAAQLAATREAKKQDLLAQEASST